VLQKHTNMPFAMKHIALQKVRGAPVVTLLLTNREIELMKKLDHPHIIKIDSVFRCSALSVPWILSSGGVCSQVRIRGVVCSRVRTEVVRALGIELGVVRGFEQRWGVLSMMIKGRTLPVVGV
jgi:hypothetical protein